jgi:hypothetical protein
VDATCEPEELVKRILLGHVDAHFGSIRKTIAAESLVSGKSHDDQPGLSAHMNQNPAARLGIDGSTDLPRGTNAA